MDEDEMYAFVGLRAEDERAEQARHEAEKQLDLAPSLAAGHAQGDLDNEADIGVTDVVQGDRDQAEVTEITPEHEIIRHAVNLTEHTYTYGEWKSRAKQGRPLGSTSGAVGPSTPKRHKVARSDSTCNCPGHITRRPMSFINAGEQGSSQIATPSRPPRATKKITPKKGKK